jgi:hypothetical protein
MSYLSVIQAQIYEIINLYVEKIIRILNPFSTVFSNSGRSVMKKAVKPEISGYFINNPGDNDPT